MGRIYVAVRVARLSGLLVVLVAAPLAAQSQARRFSVAIGAGGAIPREDLAFFMSTSPLLRVDFGYRFHRNFQADAGLDAVFRAAGVDDFQDTIIGRIKIHDHELMVPLGARAILPLASGRLELFGGGGAAYLHYGEDVDVPGSGSDSSFDCQVCRSRGGWGYYAIAGTSVALERSRRFWLGFETKLIRGATSGQPLGAVPPLDTRDTWINTAAVFVIRFP